MDWPTDQLSGLRSDTYSRVRNQKVWTKSSTNICFPSEIEWKLANTSRIRRSLGELGVTLLEISTALLKHANRAHVIACEDTQICFILWKIGYWTDIQRTIRERILDDWMQMTDTDCFDISIPILLPFQFPLVIGPVHNFCFFFFCSRSNIPDLI